MVCKSEFEKGQIVAYNHYGLSLCNIAKKLICHHSSIDVFLRSANRHLKSVHLAG